MDFNIVFFGSFRHYSVVVLERLLAVNKSITVVTTPPSPSGRGLELRPTEVQIFAEKHDLTVHTPADFDSPAFLLSFSKNPPDFLIASGYGKLLPQAWLELPKIMAINMHASLLPRYPGRFPAEWAILWGEKETGVTLVKMTERFDAGPILAQIKTPISDADTRQTIYDRLYHLGADLLIDNLPKIAAGANKPVPQKIPSDGIFYARQLTRADGFIPWDAFNDQLTTNNKELSRKWCALHPWPGVWTENPEGKRIKLISLTPPTIQYEGKNPIPWQIQPLRS
ncbi:MAG: Methionyl-tRNA formyltransferase [Candidatus Amesbacteria bacterium GW2011_GWA1_47_16]|uniref:methionyl-tRNA formyltransferase n=4 Tax=Candidatus Amesiibacteriota TaxID=1752730 RepID=A0A1F4ZW07_9BACT|nr:MAG: Methionyl-tRNA formyltransferase [Candidatus Amesbacteria bacterium GW2011_GWC1_47_15]KKU64874.1 MAG: Methionyl-tRNA formyltransferase [Candidatus Amesbacteria bacterium GW2011_GWA1_47_16]OGD01005.1 MAG: hypothetical protein A2701_04230 [Candidatus Amesbacteria bacterium RIFCSPHIGHO2_01_FULL_47_34]OGD10633.1 MAG: hypothetical protein A2395_03105 [Candidatus Amesbacteria bacterium RIFOXYB1_FULL_47_9]